MVVISENAYFRAGVLELFSKNENNNILSIKDYSIYDRGDGCITFIPVEIVIYFKKNNISIFDFLSYDFPTVDVREITIFELKCYLIRLNKQKKCNYFPNKRKMLNSNERVLLDSFFSGESIINIAKRTTKHSLNALYLKKNNALRKLGVLSLSKMVKLQRNWDFFFNYSSPSKLNIAQQNQSAPHYCASIFSTSS